MHIIIYKWPRGKHDKKQKKAKPVNLGRQSVLLRPLSVKNIFTFILVLACIICLNEFGISETIKTVFFEDDGNSSWQIEGETEENSISNDYIKWMSFDVPLEVMQQALSYDILSYNTDAPIDWIQLIAYGAAKNWGKFEQGEKCEEIDAVVIELQNGKKMYNLTKDLKLYDFYLETYSAVLNGFVGEFEVEETNPDNPEEKIYVKKYGLKVFSPIAKGFNYSHYDDFGNSRSYGYKREHLGNDLMGSVGTPVVAVEDGYVEVMGWNQYGGWRIGIRSNDKKRYYYYAHLRKDIPFASTLKEGDLVQSGDVIGYLGMTGYSKNENVNNIKVPHLHFGMQIIFDESQKDSVNQIWIDVYQIVNFLAENKMTVYREAETKDYIRAVNINNNIID